MAACGFDQNENCDDCVQVVRNTKTVQVPCTVNRYKQYTVKVPRQVSEQVPRTVQYTDFESRQKQVPYTDYRSERRTRMETQKYQVPVTTTHTKMVPVTKKVPKTVYVDITTQVPKSFTKTTMQTKERQVPVPYYANVPETKYRTITEQVPVQKSKVQMDTVIKTVYDTQVRSRCVPETKIVTKQIPVYNVVAKPAPAVPLGVVDGASAGDGAVLSDFNRIDKNVDGQRNNNEVAFDIADTNINGQLSFGEYQNARASGQLGNTVDLGSGFGNATAHANTVGDYGNIGSVGDSGNYNGFGDAMGSTTDYGNTSGMYGDSKGFANITSGSAYPTVNMSNNNVCTSCEMN